MDEAQSSLLILSPKREKEERVDAKEGAIANLYRFLQNIELVEEELLSAATFFLGSHLGEERALELRDLIESFEYDQAVTKLHQLAIEIGVVLP